MISHAFSQVNVASHSSLPAEHFPYFGTVGTPVVTCFGALELVTHFLVPAIDHTFYRTYMHHTTGYTISRAFNTSHILSSSTDWLIIKGVTFL